MEAAPVMPELPEVETMVRGLRPVMEGRQIQAIEVRDPALLTNCKAAKLSRVVRDARVLGIDRNGKWVVIRLGGNNEGVIVIQPRMTGGFWLVPPPTENHVRLTLRLLGTDVLVRFCDSRRLGKLAWYPDMAAASAAIALSQGPDALVMDRDLLAERLAETRRPVKAALMDQKVLAGIGNIYADEILFRAGVHPARISSSLQLDEVDRLHASIRPLLEEAIEAEGSSFDAGYRTVLGVEGGFLCTNAVHRRAGAPCTTCGEPIVRQRIEGLTGRSTYFCPHCQPIRAKSDGRRRPPSRPKADGVK